MVFALEDLKSFTKVKEYLYRLKLVYELLVLHDRSREGRTLFRISVVDLRHCLHIEEGIVM